MKTKIDKLHSITPSVRVDWDYDYKNSSNLWTRKEYIQTLINIINKYNAICIRDFDTFHSSIVIPSNLLYIFYDLEYFFLNDNYNRSNVKERKFIERIGSIDSRFDVYCNYKQAENSIYLLGDLDIETEMVETKGSLRIDVLNLPDDNADYSFFNKDQKAIIEKINEDNIQIPQNIVTCYNDENELEKEELKHLFVFYVNVGNIDENDIEQYINEVAKKLTLNKYKGIQTLFIPTRKDYGVNTVIKLL